MASDRSTDLQDNTQLAVFVCYTCFDLVLLEVLDLIALKEIIPGVDNKNALDTTLTNAKVSLNRFVSIAAEGAPAALESKTGLIGLIKNNDNFPDFLPVHCIIHCNHLTAR